MGRAKKSDEKQYITHGPYRGRVAADLSEEELTRALRTCPYQGYYWDKKVSPFKLDWDLLAAESRERYRRLPTTIERNAEIARKAKATREAWKASMTEAERTAYDAGDRTARRVIERAVKDRRLAETQRSAEEQWAYVRAEAVTQRLANEQRDEQRRVAIEEARREFFEAHPEADDWDYHAATVNDGRRPSIATEFPVAVTTGEPGPAEPAVLTSSAPFQIPDRKLGMVLAGLERHARDCIKSGGEFTEEQRTRVVEAAHALRLAFRPRGAVGS